MSKVITRFPPSPTGLMHVGTAKTALINYLFAKKNGGEIMLRFEDTDRARSKKEFEDNIVEMTKWFGFTFDAEYRQSDRTDVYRKHIEKMIADGTAYVSDETAYIEAEGEDDEEKDTEKPERRTSVIRFKNPNKKVTFEDLNLGEISADTTELKDFVIAKSLDEPLYHLAVVVDDFELGVTHVIRGADGIYNTPRQILIQEAIGAPRPIYCHFPFLLGSDRSKLSKRNGSVPISKYKEEGYLPEALLNYFALLGWNPGTDQEIFTLPELIEAFDLTKIQKGGAIFDPEKLKWFNREHLKKLSREVFREKILEWLPQEVKELPAWSEERFERFLPDLTERISVFSDIPAMHASGEFSYIFNKPVFEIVSVLPPSKKGIAPDKAKIEAHFRYLIETLGKLSDNEFTKDGVKNAIFEYATKEGRGDVLWPMRVALSGKEKSPDPFTLAYVLGKEETVARLTDAAARLRTLNE